MHFISHHTNFSHSEIQHDTLNKHGFTCGWTTVKGGHSQSPYASFNLGWYVGDNENLVSQNYSTLQKIIKAPLLLIRQTHSNKVVLTDNNSLQHDIFTHQWDNLPEGDAIVHTGNKTIGVLTADCVPIYLIDISTKKYGIIHAGSKGALTNIIENTCAHFPNKDSTLAIIGPAIATENYEIKDDFIQNAISIDQLSQQHFLYKNDKAYFDLKGYVINKIYNQKITNIFNVNIDTYSNHDLYSYRRSGNTGRFLSFIKTY